MKYHLQSQQIESNSGAEFVFEEDYFHKLGGGSLAERVKKQALWISCLYPKQATRFPRSAFLSWGEGSVVHTSERLDYPTALEWVLVGSRTDRLKAVDIARQALRWIGDNLHQPISAPQLDYVDLLFRQTQERILHQWRLPERYMRWICREEVVLSGVPLKGVPRIMADLERTIGGGKYPRTAPSIIHGDIHLGNIITNLNDWRLLDPRGSFAGGEAYFDPYYEWGKVLHEYHGLYGLVCAHELVASFDRYDNVAFLRPSSSLLSVYSRLLSDALELLDDSLGRYGEIGFDRRKGLLFEGLLLLGIVPFHQKIPERAFTLACIGLVMLNKFTCQSAAPELGHEWLN